VVTVSHRLEFSREKLSGIKGLAWDYEYSHAWTYIYTYTPIRIWWRRNMVGKAFRKFVRFSLYTLCHFSEFSQYTYMCSTKLVHWHFFVMWSTLEFVCTFKMTWVQMSRLSVYISCVSIYIYPRPKGSMDMQHDLCANESFIKILKSSIHIHLSQMDVCLFKRACVPMDVSTVIYQDVKWMYIIDSRLGSRDKTCFQVCVYTHICIYTYMQQSKRHARNWIYDTYVDRRLHIRSRIY